MDLIQNPSLCEWFTQSICGNRLKSRSIICVCNIYIFFIFGSASGFDFYLKTCNDK